MNKRVVLMRKVGKNGKLASSGNGVRVFQSMSAAAKYLFQSTGTNNMNERSLVTHIGNAASGKRKELFGYVFNYLPN